MEKKDLQKLLSQPYKQENWKQIVQFVFPNVSILSSPKEFPINNEKIKKFRQIGSVRLNDEKNLALFELLLADTVNIQRNRVELNNEISKYIDQEQIHGVLSVFEQGTDDYRFTFSARSTEFDKEESDFVQKKTDTKRYTYVLGKNESCKTPADRFYKLSENKSEVDINAIQNAFSVEQLSKEFFDKYKKQFEKFWKYIASKEEYKGVFINGQGEREVKIRNFTKKLLGRIVFLHFLQKKGWMGCPEQELWGAGDKKFMQNLFKDFTNKEQFHSKCLVELFYNTLNAKRDDQLFSCEGLESALNNSKVPYLNGGLFDSDKVESKKIDFPESYFEDLFNFFGQYNFTIDENDPNDHEVGIDPEMLGHIFENLLEDNKDKGAFYTPKVIVQYMCQESLIEYLATKLEAETSGEVKQAIEDLIRNQLAEDISDLDLVEPIAQALFDVKICDPAIGSGAFPMGILNVIYQVINALYYLQPDSVARVWNISDTQWQPHLVKKNIIQHSIYGVDIESGAVDIARLRFWLALVVDEVEPLPLPNLDYKIMQGNSLLESFEGIDLSQISDASAYEAVYESEQIELFSGEAKKKVSMSLQFEDVKTLMDDYFNANDPETKKDLHKRIDDQVLNHIRFTLAEHKRELQKKAKKLEKKVGLDEAAARTWEQKEKIRTNSKAAKTLVKLNTELSQYNDKELKLAQLAKSNERSFFLWNLFFQEVFEGGGFDIVIGNPPYVEHKKLKHIAPQLKPIYEVYTGSSDLSVYFFEKAFNIMKYDGVFCYINTNKFFNTGYGKSLRRFLLSKKINTVLNFEQVEVFEGILVSSVIFCASKSEPNGNNFNYIEFYKENDWKQNFRQKVTARTEVFEQSIFDDREWVFEKGLSMDIKIKIEKTGSPIKNIESIDIRRGVTTGYDPAFIIPVEESKKFKGNSYVKKLYKGKELKRYKTLKESSILLFLPWHFPLHEENISGASTEAEANLKSNYPGLYEHLKRHQEGLSNRNQSETGIRYEWYCLQRCAASYYNFFDNEKIVWPLTADKWGFAFDNEGYYLNSGGFFLISNELPLKYILGFLNSRLMQFYFRLIGVMTAGGAYTLKKATIEEFPIIISESTDEVVNLVDKILEAKSKDQESYSFEKELDSIFFSLYDLSTEEIQHVIDNTR